jgi:hypothetical protein
MGTSQVTHYMQTSPEKIFFPSKYEIILTLLCTTVWPVNGALDMYDKCSLFDNKID